jgi:hypothetical protein
MRGPTIAEKDLRDRIRCRMHEGSLPAMRVANFDAGFGEGDVCIGCGEPIAKSQVEYDVMTIQERRVKLHIRCFATWQEEASRS